MYMVPTHKDAEREEINSAVEAFLASGGQIEKHDIRRAVDMNDFNHRDQPAPKLKAKKPRKPSAQEKRAERAPELRALVGTMGLVDIARTMRLSRNTLRLIAEEHGIDLPDWRKRGVAPEKLRILREYADAGARLTEAAKWLGVHRETALNWARQHGIRFKGMRT